MRPVCPVCNKHPCAPNYIKEGVRHYRSRCSTCIRKNKQLAPAIARWQQAGYKKKTVCDICKFRARYGSQITVWHLNGNLNDCVPTNLRCVCLNCVEEVKRNNFTWRRGDLEVDP